MLDLKFVCENIEEVKQRLAHRSGKFDLEGLGELAEERKNLIQDTEQRKATKNAVSKLIPTLKGDEKTAKIAEMKALGDEIKALDARLNEVEAKISEIMLTIPNLPNKEVPIGSDSDDNVEVRRWGEPTKFDFEPKAHWDIAEEKDLCDWPRASKISGARFTVYKGLGARLERAIYNFMLDTHTSAGYTEIFPPYMVNKNAMIGTGQLPKFAEDMYYVNNEGQDFYLVPTAEVPVTNLHREEIIPYENLPIYYCAYTACFRGEAGSAGRDTRGLIRQHQFNKVELVKFTTPETSYAELEHLTNSAEKILQTLGIPYRVVCLCTGDLGFGSAKTYDIEVWMPSYNRYVEISSCSDYEDFQARRASIRYRDKDGKVKLVHTLNGSGLAVGRTTAAILENFQQADGSIVIPEALRKYMGVDKID
ncbi:MAG: serine--tRNA ligase [Clostridia bacterium]|nr:serine--tRNA ligase [Clostridia bacterium]